MKLRRSVSFLLVLAMVCAWLPAVSAAEVASGTCGDNLTWTLDDSGTLTISGTGDMTDYEYGTSPWYDYVDAIAEVKISDGVTSVGCNAFQGCIGLKSISVPDSVTHIGEHAFYCCYGLESVNLPSGINVISSGMFANCEALRSITIPDGVTYIGIDTFLNCRSLVSVTIPESVVDIDVGAFGGSCESLAVVYYAGSEEAWNAIEISEDNDPLLAATICFDGQTGVVICTHPVTQNVFVGDYASFSIEALGSDLSYQWQYRTSSAGSWLKATATGNQTATLTVSGTLVRNGYQYRCRVTDGDGNVAVSDVATLYVTDASYLAAGACGEDVIWTLTEDGLLTVSGTGNMYDYSDGRGHWNSYADSIVNVVIESGITGIGSDAFHCCYNLASISIPDTVTSIGANSFVSCVSLSEITIPDGVTFIGNGAFGRCIGLTEFVFPAGIGMIEGGTLYECEGLLCVTIPASVTSIGNDAFYGCNQLSAVFFGGSETAWNSILIDTNNDPLLRATKYYNGTSCILILSNPEDITAFTGDTAVFSVTALGSNLSYQWQYRTSATGTWANAAATGNKTATLSVPATNGRNGYQYRCKITDGSGNVAYTEAATLTVMNTSNLTAYGSCGETVSWALDSSGTMTIFGSGRMDDYHYVYAPWKSLESQMKHLVVEDGITYIGRAAFAESSLTTATIPSSVESIGRSAFSSCTELESITIPYGLMSICENAFACCYNLTDITIPDSVTTIEELAFQHCESLTEIVIPDSVTSLGNAVFNNCTGLKSITLSGNISVLGSELFRECTRLSTITIPDSVTVIDWMAFYRCSSLATVMIGSGLESLGADAFYECNSIKKFVVSENNSLFSSDSSGVLFNKDKTTLILAPKKFAGNYSVPSTVITIEANAFSGCTGLTGISLPNSVTTIGYGAFRDCTGLTSVAVPNSVTYLGGYAFYGCAGLKNIVLGNAISVLEEFTFSCCTNLTSIRIPDGVTSIVNGVFRDSNALGTIEIPTSVTHIGVMAFYGTRLAIVNYWGTSAQWAAIDIEDYNDPLFSATKYFNYTPELTITIQPTGQKVLAGEDAVFSVTATGSRLTYQWQYRTSASGVWQNCTATGNKTATMTVPATTGKSGWQYRCVVTDSAGNSKNTNAVYLYVLGITAQPTGQKVLAGENAVFTVAATGHQKTYQWQYRTSADGTWAACTATGNKTSSMTVEALSWKSGYQYRCRITDSAGNVKYTNVVYLYVLDITTQPEGQKVVAGTNAVFRVSATGHQKTYQWQYRTSSDGTWTACTDTGNKSATLTVAATTALSSRQYRCQITDSVGNVVYTKVVYLYVLGIKTQPTGQKVVAGTNAVFSVSATGHGKTYQWQYRTSSSGEWQNCTATGNKTATMTVPATTGKSSWQYRCQITDSVGNVIYTNVVYLYVLGVTGQPADTTAAAGGTAQFTFTATGHSKTYQWQYSADGGMTWKNTTATGCKSRTLTVAVTAAKDGYMYRCQITDSVGNVIYTDAAKLTVE